VVELFLLNPHKDDYSFEVLLRPLKKIREGEEISFGKGICAVLVDKDKRIVRFNKKNIVRHLRRIGHIPLPPYIKRPDTNQDRVDYQTVYAKHSGSVASPTAGLHFTKELMGQLKSQGHRFTEVTLHINYGTSSLLNARISVITPCIPSNTALNQRCINALRKQKYKAGLLVAVERPVAGCWNQRLKPRQGMAVLIYLFIPGLNSKWQMP